jgi:TrmH family RNA methyltransferase
MLSKNEHKYIQSLCQKKQRQQEGLFIAEGTKLINELLRSDFEIERIYAVSGWVPELSTPALVTTVTEAELQKISLLQTPNQVFAIVKQKQPLAMPDFSNRFTLVLDGIQDPGNMGTLIRIADWFGITQVIASEDSVEFYNPKVIQSTMGSFLRVNLWYASLSSILQSPKVPVFGALLSGKDIHTQSPITEGMLIIGNESKGISTSLMPFINHPVSIPRQGGAESLNAAVAAGIIISHLKKA